MNTTPFLLLRRASLVAVVLIAVTFAVQARAITLTAANMIGYVTPGTPANPENETSRLQFFIDLRNIGIAVAPDGNEYFPNFDVGQFPATLPGPATLATTIVTGTLPVVISSPYTYLMAKFGPDSVFYYLGGQTGSLDALFIPNGLGTNGNGLSHISLFNQTGESPRVPEGGATVTLLGGALALLTLVRRRWSANSAAR